MIDEPDIFLDGYFDDSLEYHNIDFEASLDREDDPYYFG